MKKDADTDKKNITYWYLIYYKDIAHNMHKNHFTNLLMFHEAHFV